MSTLASLASVTALPPRELPAEGEVLLACPVGRGGLMLFGWHTARLPRLGLASVGEARGKFRLHAWAHARPGAAWFVAVVQLPPQTPPAPDAALVLHATGRPDRAIAALPARPCSPEQLANALATHGAALPGPIALFLAELCIAASRGGALKALLAAFLHKAAEDDGVVEIVGQADGTLMLQGWGRIEPDAAEALLCDAQVSRHQARLAAFPRPDIASPATGVVTLLEGAESIAPQSVHALFLVTGAALRRRAVLPVRQVLNPTDTGNHLRDLLPRLDCDAETACLARRMMRPRFTGADTLATLDRPVRAAIDLAAVFPGAGVYLAGWLIDPDALVREVSLCGAEGLRVRLDRHATRLPRPDVAEAFAADPRYAGADAPHGLAVFAEAAGAADGLHLDIDLGDGVAFLPLRPMRGSVRAKLRRVLQSIDLHRALAHAAIARQVGPLLRRVLAQGVPLPRTETLRPAQARRHALLLPMPLAGTPPQTALSFLLADPLRADEALVLACPPCWTDQDVARLDSALRLYALDATVLRLTEPAEWTEALEVCARATEAEGFFCLGPGVLGVSPGWRGHLAVTGDAVAFPTALYEDHAVRSIGVAAIEKLPGAPWSRAVRPGSGRPCVPPPPPQPSPASREREGCHQRPLSREAGEGWGGGGAAAPKVGSLAGAHVSRAAWQAAGGFAGGALLAEAQEIAFFQRLAAHGVAPRHVPQSQVFALDDSLDRSPPHWRQVARLVDGWLLANVPTTEAA
jgi:hypothetical protein